MPIVNDTWDVFVDGKCVAIWAYPVGMKIKDVYSDLKSKGLYPDNFAIKRNVM